MLWGNVCKVKTGSICSRRLSEGSRLGWVELSRDIYSRHGWTHNSHNSAGRRYVRDTKFCTQQTSAATAMWVLSWRLNRDGDSSSEFLFVRLTAQQCPNINVNLSRKRSVFAPQHGGRQNGWHRYGTKKLRHCYIAYVLNKCTYQLSYLISSYATSFIRTAVQWRHWSQPWPTGSCTVERTGLPWLVQTRFRWNEVRMMKWGHVRWDAIKNAPLRYSDAPRASSVYEQNSTRPICS